MWLHIVIIYVGMCVHVHLWAVVSGWLLKVLERCEYADVAKTNTSYVDDFLFKWVIDSGRALIRGEIAGRATHAVQDQ